MWKKNYMMKYFQKSKINQKRLKRGREIKKKEGNLRLDCKTETEIENKNKKSDLTLCFVQLL